MWNEKATLFQSQRVRGLDANVVEPEIAKIEMVHVDSPLAHENERLE